MVVDAVVSAFLSAINALLSLIPSFTIPTLTGANGLNSAVAYGRVFNRIIPMEYFMGLVAVTLVLHAGLVLFDIAVWVWHQVHGSD